MLDRPTNKYNLQNMKKSFRFGLCILTPVEIDTKQLDFRSICIFSMENHIMYTQCIRHTNNVVLTRNSIVSIDEIRSID